MKEIKKKIKAWAGFINEKIDTGWFDNEKYIEGLYCIFKTKNEAQEHFKNIRKVEISLIKKKK